MKRFFTMLTTAYTLTIIFFSAGSLISKRFLNYSSGKQSPEFINIKIFILVSIAILCMMLYEKFLMDYRLFSYIAADFSIRFLIAFAVAYLGGVGTQIIRHSPVMMLMAALTIFIVVLITYPITYLSISMYASKINRRIRDKSRSSHED